MLALCTCIFKKERGVVTWDREGAGKEEIYIIIFPLSRTILLQFAYSFSNQKQIVIISSFYRERWKSVESFVFGVSQVLLFIAIAAIAITIIVRLTLLFLLQHQLPEDRGL